MHAEPEGLIISLLTLFIRFVPALERTWHKFCLFLFLAPNEAGWAGKNLVASFVAASLTLFLRALMFGSWTYVLYLLETKFIGFLF
jgi:hypothetical protein